MQMHDTLRQSQGASAVDALAASFNIAPAEAGAAMRATAAELAWALETRCLNRDGLADVVEAVGRADQASYLGPGNVLQTEAARADGDRLLALLLGPADARAMLAARVARRARSNEEVVAAMLPTLAALTMAALAGRARGSLGDVLARMPPLGRWSKGSPHADLADILRRRCGGGPYANGKLRRVVHRIIARAGGFGLRPVGWYLRFMLLRPTTRLARPMLSRAFRD